MSDPDKTAEELKESVLEEYQKMGQRTIGGLPADILMAAYKRAEEFHESPEFEIILGLTREYLKAFAKHLRIPEDTKPEGVAKTVIGFITSMLLTRHEKAKCDDSKTEDEKESSSD